MGIRCWHRHTTLFFILQLQRALLGVSRLLSLFGDVAAEQGALYQPYPHHPSTATADKSSSRVAAAIFIYSAFTLCECYIVHSPLLTVQFSADQQGSINERPLTIRSQLWLSEHATVCSFTQLHLPDNCVIRVCINN